MNVILFLVLHGLSFGGASLLDIYITGANERGSYHATDFNISVARYNSFELRTVFDGPLFVLVALPPSHPLEIGSPNQKLIAYYTGFGLQSLPEQPKFLPLHQLLLGTPRMSALAYPGGGSNFLEMHKSQIEDVILASNFFLIDLVRGTEYANIAFLYVAPRHVFNLHRFGGLKRVGRFQINPFSVDPVWAHDPSFRLSLPHPKISLEEERVFHPIDLSVDLEHFPAVNATAIGTGGSL